jgi:8-amino-7-oxononanoate synthase
MFNVQINPRIVRERAFNRRIVIDRLGAELAALESQTLLRHLEAPGGIDLNSNDYLGLAGDPRMKQAILRAVDSAPRIASTGSRLLSGHDDAWTALETEFAEWVGAESALYFTSGYAANVGLLSAILRPEDVVFSDSSNHASLIDGMRLAKCKRVIFSHLDLNALEDGLRRNLSPGGARLIVVESIFSMDGDRAPLADLIELAERHGAELIVDEAHALGVCGPAGSGSVAEAGLSGRVLATVYTCGKALAAAGAFVCGSETLRQFLINRARPFLFNTGLPPYFAAQVAAGMRLAAGADAERAHLAGIAAFLINDLKQNGFNTGGSDSQIVPVILGANDTAVNFAAHLQTRGFGVRAIRPPTVAQGSARLRFSLSALHSEETLAELVRAMVLARNRDSLEQSVSSRQ